MDNKEHQKQIYVIFSVDTEHDIISKYQTKVAGWSKGIPLLFKIFDKINMRGKVCWLMEYNLKDHFPAINPNSEFYVKDITKLVKQIKNRDDEMGIHPTMYEWIGRNRELSISSYNDSKLWNQTRSFYDYKFVNNLITSCTEKFKEIFEINPIGCRTGAFHFAIGLAYALEMNGIYIDSSIPKGLKSLVISPNAYYATGINIKQNKNPKTNVLEIPTTGYIDNKPLYQLMKLRTWYLVHQQNPIFLSFFIHNWQAITYEGKENLKFLKCLFSFLKFLKKHNACFLSWKEAYEIYKNIYKINKKINKTMKLKKIIEYIKLYQGI